MNLQNLEILEISQLETAIYGLINSTKELEYDLILQHKKITETQEALSNAEVDLKMLLESRFDKYSKNQKALSKFLDEPENTAGTTTDGIPIEDEPYLSIIVDNNNI